MALFATAEVLEADLLPALRAFLGSPAGAETRTAVAGHDGGAVLAARITHPDVDVWVDFASGEAGTGARDDAAAHMTVDGDSLHHIAMNQLSPAEVARAVEEKRLDADGSFELMLTVLTSLDALGDFWRRTLEENERAELIAAPAPPAASLYQIEHEVRRQGYVPSWGHNARRAVSRPTRRVDD